MGLCLSQRPDADALLDRDPLALLIGMVLDQQIPLEKAFASPYVLTQRLGHDLDAREIVEYDPQALVALFAAPPALHRFPRSMALRVRQVCQALVEHYDGKVDRLWADVENGRELLERLKALPGFGEQKAKIFLALLGKQRGVTPAGWREAAGGYGEVGSYRSVADIVDADSLARVREFKQAMKAKSTIAK
ncbi:MAG: Fe-S cluster assembly protein HesB [Pseudonocardia sp.]|nr:Fe-S cluster assembly protein HesB [Pseudonocardia sp.]